MSNYTRYGQVSRKVSEVGERNLDQLVLSFGFLFCIFYDESGIERVWSNQLVFVR